MHVNIADVVAIPQLKLNLLPKGITLMFNVIHTYRSID